MELAKAFSSDTGAFWKYAKRITILQNFDSLADGSPVRHAAADRKSTELADDPAENRILEKFFLGHEVHDTRLEATPIIGGSQ